MTILPSLPPTERAQVPLGWDIIRPTERVPFEGFYGYHTKDGSCEEWSKSGIVGQRPPATTGNYSLTYIKPSAMIGAHGCRFIESETRETRVGLSPALSRALLERSTKDPKTAEVVKKTFRLRNAQKGSPFVRWVDRLSGDELAEGPRPFLLKDLGWEIQGFAEGTVLLEKPQSTWRLDLKWLFRAFPRSELGYSEVVLVYKTYGKEAA